jgi:hypothetical protein
MSLALVKESMPPARLVEIKQLYCPTCGGETNAGGEGKETRDEE